MMLNTQKGILRKSKTGEASGIHENNPRLNNLVVEAVAAGSRFRLPGSV